MAPSRHGMRGRSALSEQDVRDLVERDDDHSDMESDDEEEKEEEEMEMEHGHVTIHLTATSTSTTKTALPTTTATPAAVTLAPSSRPIQAGANETDPNGSLSRVSEDGIHTGARTGIAFGVIGGIALLSSVIYFFWRRHKRHQKTLSSSTSRSLGPGPGLSSPPGAGSPLPPANTRTDSQILDELMTSAYAHQNGGIPITDEKHRVTSSYSSEAEAEVTSFPYNQAKIRPSIASWLRRHHPLQLNSLSRWSGTTTTTTVSSVPTTPFSISAYAARNTFASSASSSRRNTSAENEFVPPPPVPALPAVVYVPSSSSVPPLTPAAAAGGVNGVGEGGEEKRGRQNNSRFKSVWSDTTVESDVDRQQGRGGHMSVFSTIGSPVGLGVVQQGAMETRGQL
ncbi:hypothetical protein QBC47DRAFT_69076 [Echria macrotheca]|uniref:Uncharacterized protein n=1 Tax=Echria macrotheca TaxID=438768 RepID=A0AAJ0B5Y1_9PEZI|nr:hypothetical protein QBC47DRAFT_69076 [Echria macrotheca]